MLDLLLNMIPGGGLTAIVAAIVAALGAVAVIFKKGDTSGAAREKAKQAKAEIKAKDDLLEMHREATQAERDAGALSDEKARKEAEAWARR